MPKSPKTVGFLGGSFDPPHMGHVLLAAVGLVGLGLDEVWFVPCRHHPFDKPLSSFEDRTRMCVLATAALGDRVRVDPIEGELGPESEPSYTVDTLEAIHTRHPGVKLRLLLGSDIVQETGQWRNFDRIRRLAEPLVVPRMGYGETAQTEGPETLPALSSSTVRERVAQGLPLDGWVPRAVEQYIRRRGLYRDPSR
jgi:nicotinate-nucleotide adenylyltransferase